MVLPIYQVPLQRLQNKHKDEPTASLVNCQVSVFFPSVEQPPWPGSFQRRKPGINHGPPVSRLPAHLRGHLHFASMQQDIYWCQLSYPINSSLFPQRFGSLSSGEFAAARLTFLQMNPTALPLLPPPSENKTCSVVVGRSTTTADWMSGRHCGPDRVARCRGDLQKTRGNHTQGERFSEHNDASACLCTYFTSHTSGPFLLSHMATNHFCLHCVQRAISISAVVI